MNTRRHLILGIFFVAVAGLLAYFTLFMAEFQPWSDRQTVKVYFSQTNGLRQGSPVLVAGMRWGKVTNMEFDPNAPFDERIEVTFVLDEPVQLKEDVRILIKDATLLGGKELAVEPGSPRAAPLDEAVKLYGAVQGNVVQELENFVADNRDDVRTAIENLTAVSEQLSGTQGTLGRLINDVALADEVAGAVQEIRAVSTNLRSLSDSVLAGEGTVGRLFQDEGLYREILASVEDIRQFSAEGRETLALARDPEKGAVGRVLNDPEVGADLKQLVASARRIADQVESGQGTLGKLVYDEQIAIEIQKAAEDFGGFAASLRDDGGVLGALTSDPELAAQVREIVTNLQVASRGFVSPDSTIGRLLTTDDVYEDLRTALGTLQGSLEEAREAAPITAFLSTIFLGF